MWMALIGVALMVSFSVSRHATSFAAAVAAMLVAGLFAGPNTGDVLHAERTFFGVYRVMNDPDGQHRSLFHGTTLHGRQSLDPTRAAEPLTYYHRSGPIGQLLTALAGPLERGHIGAIGLGTGSLAAYATAAQRWTFYEIDPAVVRIAQDPRFFTYLHHAPPGIGVVQGDARLALNAAAPRSHDLLILDAFSSDAVPVHLITREALMVYQQALAPGGVLAFHISNRHLSLLPVLARLAAEQNLAVLTQLDTEATQDTAPGKTASQWVVMARSGDDLQALASDARWVRPDFNHDEPVWTDDFSNIISVVNRF
jgi:predicted O-methyltransferase YrrM